MIKAGGKFCGTIWVLGARPEGQQLWGRAGNREHLGPAPALRERGEGPAAASRQVNAMIRAFYLLLWSVGAWPRAVENMDQVGRVKLRVSCAGTDLLLSFWVCADSAPSRFP